MMNTVNQKNIFKQLELTQKEIKIYKYLLSQTDSKTIKETADKTGINRTTVYRYLDSLAKKGLIDWIIAPKGKKVKSTPPSNLHKLLDKKKSEVKVLEETLPELISKLNNIQKRSSLKSQVRYFTKKSGYKQMIWNTLKTEGIMRSYTNFKRRLFVDKKFEEKFELEWSRRNLRDKVITHNKRKTYIKKELVKSYRTTLQIRLIDSEKFDLDTDISIYNNTVSIASLKKDNISGVEIENKQIADAQRIIFDIVWENAIPLDF